MTTSYKLLACGVAAASAAALPASALASKRHHRSHANTITGVVVHENNAAGSFVVAERSGRLDAIHGRRPPVGARVRVHVRKLADGTFAERSAQRLSRRLARHARIEGVVSADDPATHEIVLSAPGTSMAVEDSAAAEPEVGERVDADVDLDPTGQASASDVTVAGAPSSFRVEGKVQSIDSAAATLTISADDDEATGGSLTIQIPPTVDVSALSAGECVEVTVTRNPDGTLVASALHLDGNSHEADSRGGDHRSRGGSDSRGGETGGQAPSGTNGPEPANSSGPGGSGDSGSGPGGSGSGDSQSGHDG